MELRLKTMFKLRLLFTDTMSWFSLLTFVSIQIFL